jgi:hypothetical protein
VLQRALKPRDSTLCEASSAFREENLRVMSESFESSSQSAFVPQFCTTSAKFRALVSNLTL